MPPHRVTRLVGNGIVAIARSGPCGRASRGYGEVADLLRNCSQLYTTRNGIVKFTATGLTG
jgi:hypothetical protein